MIVRSKILELKPFIIKQGRNKLGQLYVVLQEPLYRNSILVDFPEENIMLASHNRNTDDFYAYSDIFDFIPYYLPEETQFKLAWSNDCIN